MVILAKDIKLKVIPEDFVVNEISHIPYSNNLDGEYVYYTLTKIGYTTFEVIDDIANFFKVQNTFVNSEGLKDEDGVTTQIISVKHKYHPKLIQKYNSINNLKDKFVRIEFLKKSDKPVKEQSLFGNTFQLTLRNLTQSAVLKLIDFCNKNKNFSILNYYDYQRFGLPEGPFVTHLIGKNIIKGDWNLAYEYYIKSGNDKIDKVEITFSNSDKKEFFKQMNPHKIEFFVSSYNSFLWNNELSEIISKQKHILLEIFNRYKVTLPLDEVNLPANFTVEGYKLNENLTAIKSHKIRNTYIYITVFIDSDIEDDELYKNKKKVKINFMLTSGSYATMAVKQLLLKAL